MAPAIVIRHAPLLAFRGRLVRPEKPSPEKAEVYECGESPIGSAWVQFDLRFYVVALLFVIFDVEVAFFFPWATVFGKANTLAKAEQYLRPGQRAELTKELVPASLPPSVATTVPVPSCPGLGS